MPRYIEQLNECTDPDSADWLWIMDNSAGATDKDRKLSVAKVALLDSESHARLALGDSGKLVGQNTTAGTNSQLGYTQKFVRLIPLVSLGTKLIIPVLSQNSWNARSLLRISGVSACANTETPLEFGVNLSFAHITNISSLAAANGWGNYASAAVSSMNIEITFTTAYTGGTLGKGVLVEIDYLGFAHANNLITWNSIALN